MTLRRALVVAALAVAACHASPPPPGSVPPGTLVDPSTLPRDFMVRQHVDGAYGDKKVSFDAVVQKQGDTLLVLVLTPYGSRAFLVEQTGLQTRVEKFVPRELPFDPQFILLDVQRVFVMGLAAPPGKDGWRKLRLESEIVRERWEAGRLMERRFTRRDHRPRGEVVVRYDGGWIPGEAPPKIDLDNGWYGYRLSLRSSEYERL